MKMKSINQVKNQVINQVINQLKNMANTVSNNTVSNTEKNKTKLIGLLTILTLFWFILYFIPEIFVSLFNTILGNIILFIICILVGFNNYKYGIILAILILVIYRFKVLIKEGFKWTPESSQDFIEIQDTINPNIIFDVDLIQKYQASQEELDYFNQHALWPWSEETKKMYEIAVSSNSYVRNSLKDALIEAQKKYNESAILRILYSQTNEGQFLLNGVQIKDPNGNKMEELPSGFGIFGYESGLIGKLYNDVIKCTSSSNDSKLKRIKYTGKDGIFGQQTYDETDVDINDLEKLIPGFTFEDGPCNPCGAINKKADYSCKFKLDVNKTHYY
jgi:hypothetical protein